MPKSENVYQPFNEDVASGGGYKYTSQDIKSAVYVNSKHTRVILSMLDFSEKTVVDIGCGDGTYTADLKKDCPSATILGVDPASKAIERARKKYCSGTTGLEFDNILSDELVRRKSIFDIGVFRGVLHHVGDQQLELEKAFKISRSVIIMEPNGWNPILKVLEKVSPYHVEHKEQSFVLSQHKKWIENAGGQIRKAIYIGLVPMFCPPWMVTIGSALEPFFEKIPIVRTICCGQICILAESKVVQ